MNELANYVELLAVPGLGAMLIATLFKVARHYVQRVEDDRLRELLFELVKAAEQIYGPGKGVAKRRYVEEQLHRRGLGKVRRDAIEAAVYDLTSLAGVN